MDYDGAIRIYEKKLSDYTATLLMVRQDIKKWYEFDQTENFDAEYAGNPCRILSELEEMEERVLHMIEKTKHKLDIYRRAKKEASE